MNPLDLILWALAVLVIAVVLTLVVALIVGVVKAVRKPWRSTNKTHHIYDGKERDRDH